MPVPPKLSEKHQRPYKTDYFGCPFLDSHVRENDGPITLHSTRSNNRTTEELPGLIAVVPLTVTILDRPEAGRDETKFCTFFD